MVDLAPYYRDEAVTIYYGRCEEIIPRLNLSEVAMVHADPPYGIGVQKADDGAVGSQGFRSPSSTLGLAYRAPSRPYQIIDGDREPYALPAEIACLLDSAKVCLWGANHYSDCLPRSSSWLVWDKRHKGGDNDFADGELAWTNFGGPLRIIRHYWNGLLRESEQRLRVHPMQKPVAVVKWVFSLAKLEPGSLILSPYMGSGPEVRAAKDMGFRVIGIDKEEWCCELAVERCRQGVLPLV